MRQLSWFVLALLFFGACTEADGDEAPRPRRAAGTLTVTGPFDLDHLSVVSTSPAGNHAQSPNVAGTYLLQVSLASDGQTPAVSLGLVIASPDGVVGPGAYPVLEGASVEAPHALVSLNVGQNSAPIFSGQGLGTGGTVTVSSVADGRVTGTFEVHGRGQWSAGATGAFAFDVTAGTLTDVPLAVIP